MVKHKSVFHGIGVSEGVVTAEALVIETAMPELAERPVFADDWKVEMARLDDALASVKRHLQRLGERTLERAGPEEARIFEAQAMMVEDEDFVGKARQLIRENHIAAERAFEFVALEQREFWLESKSQVLREKVEDLSAVLQRVLRRLVGEGEVVELSPSEEPRVVLTRELTAGLTIEFDRERVAAFVSEEGTNTSHAAILARSLGIPCVMGVPGILSEVEDGSNVLVDGFVGKVVIEPGSRDIARARERDRVRQVLDLELEEEIKAPVVTLDGVSIGLRVNLDLPEELDLAVEAGAEGVGLVRTEFLVMGRSKMPSEEDQYQYFRKVVEHFPGHPILIRSYDLGGDKFPKAFQPGRDPNPFLGWRAIRVCLDYPDLFFTQIRAIARARVHGDVRLMLPLISSVSEVDESRAMVDEVLADLRNEGMDTPDELPVGVMVETPAAVMMAEELAASCDFLSVGTNDLTQYALAVDRGNARLADRFETLDPAVVRMLAATAAAAHANEVPLSVCGELASDPLGMLLLLGFGYQSLSVSPTRLPLTRWLVRRLDSAAAKGAATDALKCRTHVEVKSMLRERLKAFADISWLESDQLPAGSGSSSFQE